MGVVQRQGISSTIISYAGTVLGFINKIVLFTNILTQAQVGFINVLPQIAVLFAQFAALGTPNATLRFFPYFRQKDQQHHGFLMGFLLINVIGFALVCLVFFLFRDQILQVWEDKSPLLWKYYYLILPFIFCYVLINFFEAYLRSLYNIAFMTFVKEIFLRLPVTIGIALFAWNVISFEAFLFLYVGLAVLAALIPVIYLIYIGEFFINIRFGKVWRSMYKDVGKYTLANLMGYGSSMVLNNLDQLMLTFYVIDTQIGIFTTMVYIASVILIPYKALNRISGPYVADFWKKGDLKGIQKIYQRTSLINMMVGVFIFLGIWINRFTMVEIMQKGDYSPGLTALFILGLARIFDMTSGLNGIILNTSQKYIYDLVFQLGLLIVGISTNLLLIPIYGIEGAAIATAISLVFINLSRMIMVYVLFRLHPLSYSMITILLTGLGTFLIIEYIPRISIFPDLILRSMICTLLFGGIMLKLEVSKDVNKYIGEFARKFHITQWVNPFLKHKV